MAQILERGMPIRAVWSALWTMALVVLAIGATTNLLFFSDFVQPYCATTPDMHADLCKPCGLRWGIFGIIDPTQCPNSFVDELFAVFIAVPRFLAIVFGLAWFLTGPLLLLNFAVLLRRRRRGDQTILDTIQLYVLAYILLWGVAATVFLLFPALATH